MVTHFLTVGFRRWRFLIVNWFDFLGNESRIVRGYKGIQNNMGRSIVTIENITIIINIIFWNY